MRSDKSLDVAVEIKVSLDHGSRTALYQQIVDRIWVDVIEGILEPGQRLPTVRQLAVNLEVHLDTVSCAYAQLERLGVVHGRAGAGTFVGLKASRQSELEHQKRLDEICRVALQDAEVIGASIDDLMGLLREIRRGDSPTRRPRK
jgi:GntR family transcriptional regulator